MNRPKSRLFFVQIISRHQSGVGYVWEWELEVEGGRTVHEIDIVNERDRDVDAHTGDVF